MIDPIRLRLSAQIALRSHVTPDLRAVCIKEEHQDIIVVFFCDELSEELEDSAQVATTEIISGMPDGEDHYSRMSDTRFICEAYPKPMALFEHLVYLRYEPGYEVYRQMFPKEIFSLVNSPNLRLAGQRALLGRVTANLRRATIYDSGPAVFLHFWYDKTISELEHLLAKETLYDVQAAFQLSEPKIFDLKIEKRSFPERIDSSFNDIFMRYELLR
jgi:hypothetical protein